MRDDDVRRLRRTVPGKAALQRPAYWTLDSGFNPYHVRAHAPAIVRAVNLALVNKDYRPRPPYAHTVPKPDGGKRIVSVFQIVDAVVSKTIYYSLLGKNAALMSARSYAYRPDLSTHDAIQYVSSEFGTDDRIYVAEYDFSDYFGSISHDHVWDLLSREFLLSTPAERQVIKAFLQAPLQHGAYDPQAQEMRSGRGLPQGTSISLFLANLAAWDVDRQLERMGVSFVRYADDTLIWSRRYEEISQAANILHRESKQIGAKINLKKSHGIRLFVPTGEPTEMTPTSEVNFVGYRFSRGRIGLRDEVVVRMKSRMQYLVWSNLLEALQAMTFNPGRVKDPIDRDYQVMIMQLRRYLYGNLTEERVREFQRGAIRRMRYPGVMSYFPLVDDEEQLRAIDGWLSSIVAQALKRRADLLRSLGIRSLPTPHGLRGDALVRAQGSTSAGVPVDLTIPSVSRFASVLRKAANMYGANVVGRGTGVEEYQYQISGM
ncbi:reverse transcriptase domain-containing protein [Ruania alba]|nr:reverse transcriptase domain-containing protein [Ruania alba]